MTANNVVRFPRSPIIDAETRSLWQEATTDITITADELLVFPLEEITRLGPLVAMGNLGDLLARMAAIVNAMHGPGRVLVVDGVEALNVLLGRLSEAGRP